MPVLAVGFDSCRSFAVAVKVNVSVVGSHATSPVTMSSWSSDGCGPGGTGSPYTSLASPSGSFTSGTVHADCVVGGGAVVLRIDASAAIVSTRPWPLSNDVGESGFAASACVQYGAPNW